MTKLNQDFTMFQGETKTLQVPIVDKDGNPQSLTGATVRWELRKGTKMVLLRKTGAASNPITLYNASGTDDGVSIPLVPDDTKGLQSGEYVHECRAVLVGTEEVLFEGTVTLKYSATKD